MRIDGNSSLFSYERSFHRGSEITNPNVVLVLSKQHSGGQGAGRASFKGFDEPSYKKVG